MKKLIGHPILNKIKGGLIVSCQALEEEPLYGSNMMAAMAYAAQQGGAVGIRANSPRDIQSIKKKCHLPLIGLYKKHYSESPVYITPTIEEVTQVVEAGADIVAIDATAQSRPGGETLEHFISAIRKKHPETLIVADISSFEEGKNAIRLGVDILSTTLSGYTPYSPQIEKPDIELVKKLADLNVIPVLAEGRIWTVEECSACMAAGAFAVVVGTAITRPQEITRRFVQSISKIYNENIEFKS